MLDTNAEAFDLSSLKHMSKIRLILLPSSKLKLLSLHNAGCQAIDSIWNLEHHLMRCDLIEEYTKRLIYAKLLWATGNRKLIKTTFIDTYLSSAMKKKDCLDEIERLSHNLVSFFKKCLSLCDTESENAFVKCFANYFFGSFDPRKRSEMSKKSDKIKDKINTEKQSIIYTGEPTLLYNNLTPAAIGMLKYVLICDDIDFLFSKIFTKNFSLSLSCSDRRSILHMELCYGLLHYHSRHARQNMNKMIHTIFQSMLAGDEVADDFSIKSKNRSSQEMSAHIKSLPLLKTKADYPHSLRSKPNVKGLDRLLRSDTLTEETVFELIDLTREFCTWRTGYRRGRLVVDGERVTFLRRISSRDTPIVERAMKTASDFEVMRPFHLSPALAFDPDARDIQRACLFLLMLSMVNNVFFVPETDVQGNTVIVTPSARAIYLPHSPNDMHITLKTVDSPILSADVLTEVIQALIAKEDYSV